MATQWPTHSHIYLGEEYQSFLHDSRRRWPVILISIPTFIQQAKATKSEKSEKSWRRRPTHLRTYLGGDGHSSPFLSRRRWPLIPIPIQEEMATHSHPIQKEMATHSHSYLGGDELGGDGHSFPFLCRGRWPHTPIPIQERWLLIPIPIQEEIAILSHFYLGGDGHSFPFLSRRRWPLIPIPI